MCFELGINHRKSAFVNMKESSVRVTVSSLIVVAIACAAILLTGHSAPTNTAVAQSKSKSSKSKSKSKKRTTVNLAAVKALELRNQRNIESFIREIAEIAEGFEEQGQLVQAKTSLETILKLRPDLTAVGKKIKELEEEMMNANEFEVEIDTAKRWTQPIGRVAKGKPLRIEAEGTYRFITNVEVGPEGFPTGDPTKGLTAGVQCGALMGLIVTKGKKSNKLSKPFRIGEGKQFTPSDDGLLFINVNVPPKSRCIGRIKLKLSGYIAPAK
jgi:hypothetical protein